MFCRNCGKEIDDKAVVCIHCGVSANPNGDVVDNGGFGWGLLGCCIPLVGLVLFLVWKDSKPKTAKSAGIGALIAFGGGILIYVILFILGMIGASL